MKIVMLGHKRIPSREGGVEIVVEELASRMVSLGHSVIVYNRKGSHVAGIGNEQSEYGNTYSYKGIQVKTVFTFQKKSLNAIVYAFFATIKAVFSGADIVHYHAEGPCAMLPFAKLFGKKCVATIHGLDWQRAKWGGFATKFLLFGEKMAAKYADTVIVLSQGVQQYFKDTYGRETILIPNGIVEPEYVQPQIIKEKHGLQTQNYILFLARLVPEKGLHTLLEAYEKSGVTVPLVVAGGSSHSDEYCEQIDALTARINERAKKECTGQKVIRTGFVQGRELEELYSNAMLYVLPSEIEGMPLSLLEAMSYGNLCLTSDIPENTDVTGEYGYSFQTGNAESLAAKLKEIVSEYAVIRATEQFKPQTIKEYILGKFNWEDITKRTIACYESINRQ